MCYNTAKNFNVDQLFDHYKSAFESLVISDEVRTDWQPLYRDSGFDNNYAPVVTGTGIAMYKWGLIRPDTKSWAQAEKLNKGTLNCIHEDMYQTPSYVESARNHRRCLIPVVGFFESQHIHYGKKDPLKQPYYIYRDEPKKIFSLAGIWSMWDDPDGNTIRTYSILTTAANQLLSKIHNSKLRAPVIIDEENYRDWLDPDLTLEEETALCRPYRDSRLGAYTVAQVVNKKKPGKNEPDPANFEAIINEVPPLSIPEIKKARKSADTAQGSLF